MRNPKWTEDELVVALDLYHDLPKGEVSSKNAAVRELSSLLNRMNAAEKRTNDYRNPNGVALKLHNFTRFDLTASGTGMTHGGKLEKVVWDRFVGKRGQLKEYAQVLRKRHAESASDTLFPADL